MQAVAEGTRCFNRSAGLRPAEQTHVPTRLMAQVGELGVLPAANRSTHPSCGLPAEGRKEACLAAHPVRFALKDRTSLACWTAIGAIALLARFTPSWIVSLLH